MKEPVSRPANDAELHEIMCLLEKLPEDIVLLLAQGWLRIASENGWSPDAGDTPTDERSA